MSQPPGPDVPLAYQNARFLESEDEYFDYAPAKKPPQGRWRISGLALPDAVLRKIYYDNAARLLGIKALAVQSGRL